MTDTEQLIPNEKKAKSFLKDFIHVCERVANNEIASAKLRKRLQTALGVGIKKKNGDLRVIAIGNSIVSVVGSLIARRLREAARERFDVTNLGLT